MPRLSGRKRQGGNIAWSKQTKKVTKDAPGMLRNKQSLGPDMKEVCINCNYTAAFVHLYLLKLDFFSHFSTNSFGAYYRGALLP